MAIAVVQRLGKGSSGAVSSLSIGSGDGWSGPTAGNILVVTANSDATVTISGSGWTAGPSVIDGNGTYAWYKASTGTESTITVTPGVSARTAMTVHELSGASLPIDASNSSTIAGSNGTTTSAASVTTTATGDFIIAAALLHSYTGSSPSSPSWTSSFTNTLSPESTPLASGDCKTFIGERLVGAAGSYSTSCSWTTQAGDRQHIALAFKEAAGGSTVNGTATLSSTSSLAAAANVVRAGTATLASSSALTSAAEVRVSGAAALASTSSLTAAGSVRVSGAAGLASTSGLTATTTVLVGGAATLASTSTLTATVGSAVAGAATLGSTSALTAAGSVVRAGSASLASSSTLTAAAAIVVRGTAGLTSSSALTAAGSLRITTTAVLTSTSSLTAAVGSQNQPGQMTPTTTAATARGRDTAATSTASMWP